MEVGFYAPDPGALEVSQHADAIDACADRRSAVTVKLDLNLGLPLGQQIEVAAYYVVSEALANTAKHAQASVIDLRVQGDSALTLSIRDDGGGAPTPAAARASSACKTGSKRSAGQSRSLARPATGRPCTPGSRLTAPGNARPPIGPPPRGRSAGGDRGDRGQRVPAASGGAGGHWLPLIPAGPGGLPPTAGPRLPLCRAGPGA